MNIDPLRHAGFCLRCFIYSDRDKQRWTTWQAGPAQRSRRGIHPIVCPRRHCNPGIPIRTPRLKRRFVSSALRFWSPLFIDAARSCTQIDTASSPMGLQHTTSKLRSGYVEGWWSRARYESPVRVRSFVTSSFKVHLPVDLWCSIEAEGRGLGWNVVVRLAG